MPNSEHDELTVESGRRGGVSVVWIVPIIAAALGGTVAWQSLANRGPLVEISFEEAKGIKAGKTEIKHKDVVIGVVEDVAFASDLENVVVTARLAPELEPFLGDTTDFWVVSANISGTDLSGLGTILSGSYIEVDWSSVPTQKLRQFKGLSVQPISPPSAEGRHVSLRSLRAQSVDIGSPIYFRGIQVGRVESRFLHEDFRSVGYTAFVEAPYDVLVNQDTNFWNVSGLRVDASTDGLSVNFASLDALISGGVEFGNDGLGVMPSNLEEGHVFTLYENLEAAQESEYSDPEEPGFRFMVSFSDSIAGLEPGAPVNWQGIRVGTVQDLQLDFSEDSENAAINVVIEIQPKRVGIEFEELGDAQQSIQAWVDSGMRVRMASGNILSGKKFIQLVDAIGEESFAVDFSQAPYPTLPTAPSNFDAIAEDAEELVQNLAELPLDDLITAAVLLLENTNALVANPEMQELPSDLNATLASFEGLAVNLQEASANLPEFVDRLNRLADVGELALAGVSPDSELYVDLAGAVRDTRDAARSLAALAALLEDNPNALILGKN